MDINKKSKSNNQIPHPKHKLWGLVLAVMAIIIAAWAIWFYPKTISKIKQDSAYSSFKKEVDEAVGIFKKPESQNSNTDEQSQINELRERVFGDKTGK